MLCKKNKCNSSDWDKYRNLLINLDLPPPIKVQYPISSIRNEKDKYGYISKWYPSLSRISLYYERNPRLIPVHWATEAGGTGVPADEKRPNNYPGWVP